MIWELKRQAILETGENLQVVTSINDFLQLGDMEGREREGFYNSVAERSQSGRVSDVVQMLTDRMNSLILSLKIFGTDPLIFWIFCRADHGLCT